MKKIKEIIEIKFFAMTLDDSTCLLYMAAGQPGSQAAGQPL
jgi:hypothetical protein